MHLGLNSSTIKFCRVINCYNVFIGTQDQDAKIQTETSVHEKQKARSASAEECRSSDGWDDNLMDKQVQRVGQDYCIQRIFCV